MGAVFADFGVRFGVFVMKNRKKIFLCHVFVTIVMKLIIFDRVRFTTRALYLYCYKTMICKDFSYIFARYVY